MTEKTHSERKDDTKRLHNTIEAVPKLHAEIERLMTENAGLMNDIKKVKEKQVVAKALGLTNYPTDCNDMIPIEGEPTLRQCICPSSERPIALLGTQGRFIVDHPKICWRCRALGYRKVKKPKKKETIQRIKKRNFRESARSKAFIIDGSYSAIDDPVGLYNI